MTVFVCLDDNNGMMFNGRRQSRDKAVVERVCEISGSSRLYANLYSSPLFDGADNLITDDDPMGVSQNGDYCFIENLSLKDYLHKIEKIIIYRWNRKYPSDFKFDVDVSSWKYESRFEFKGNSHDLITEEVYTK